jgi:hypothetical protein
MSKTKLLYGAAALALSTGAYRTLSSESGTAQQASLGELGALHGDAAGSEGEPAAQQPGGHAREHARPAIEGQEGADDEYEPSPLDVPLTADFVKAAAKRVTGATYRDELARIERELAYEASKRAAR